MIKIIDLYKSFGPKEVLKGVDLVINKGENLVVLGGSGTGKSVLLKHLVGLLRPDKGEILINNENVCQLYGKKLWEVRKKFGMLFQGSALFDSMTVGENVGFALKEQTFLSKIEIEEKVKEKLEVVGLKGIEHVMPADLSGGMRKRVGLARAIAIEPEVLLYDEPTTGLDPIMSDVINDLIIDMRDKLKMTSVTITHDLVSAYKIADRIAMLSEGKIVFVGSPSEFKENPHPYIQKFISAGRRKD